MTTPESTHRQPFHKFFDSWLSELHTNLEQLVSAANHHHDDDNTEDDSDSYWLIDKAIEHYEEYYKSKSDGAKEDVLSMFMPPRLSTLEDSFLWVGGWRPTTAVQLLHSKSGIQIEARLADLVPRLNFRDLGDLTSNQMNQINELHKKTIREEREITEKMAKLQQSAPDTPMVYLSNMESEMIRKNEDDGRRDIDQMVESELDGKNDKLVEILHMADDLRMETLKSVVEILTPLQALYFLIAAAELHLRLHEWGRNRDPA
ncbi:hypothetical protein L2E82_29318 [Cichorium intybus]|uniref:Uncharacterized protein n=1 Tax=Cichorium intybus TaxID=13427 RepID=A0ACB9CXH5_CICIN|nr:hypothetical protein L2E82_29318 [Cichorium intybus]